MRRPPQPDPQKRSDRRHYPCDYRQSTNWQALEVRKDTAASGVNRQYIDDALHCVYDANFNVVALVNTGGHIVERCCTTPAANWDSN